MEVWHLAPLGILTKLIKLQGAKYLVSFVPNFFPSSDLYCMPIAFTAYSLSRYFLWSSDFATV